MLRRGAAHVTGVDVGHGQMAEPLRSDSRVTLLERSHFKHLRLSEARGPFDFFTVDVSFASARSMLHPLAMRLSVGAQGVVLVKPQFELPKVLVPTGGVVESRNLRKLALNRFKRRARSEGFEVIERFDSPVPGGDGNVEFLVWLRFGGRPARAPSGASADDAGAPPDD
jgi:23S rRNA (cytidine1920-2'-O)/16S rRNA (cytidine1409-2'-O)-methyltransferase